MTEIFFGVLDVEDDWIILNHLILIAKYYIYTCSLKKVNPSLRVYKAKISASSRKKDSDKAEQFNKTLWEWERLLPHFSSDMI